MSDPTTSLPLTAQEPSGPTPGQMIRQAREAMGLHIVALAAALKVPVRKLEALEANRWEELTDTTFTRALASSVARHLKIDAAPVLAGLPTAALAPLTSSAGLGRVKDGHSPVSLALTPSLSFGRPAWLVAALLAGAVALYFSPQLVALLPVAADAPAEAAATAHNGGAATALATIAVPPMEPITPPPQAELPAVRLPEPPAIPVGPAATVADAPTSTESGRVLVLSATVDTWVEVTDSGKRVRIQRVLKQGEEAVFAEGAPFGVVLGNAAGARVTVRGQPLDFVAQTKNNVARFEVK